MERTKYIHRDNIKTALLFFAMSRDNLQKKTATPAVEKELKYLNFIIDEFSIKILENFEHLPC
jgi:hypothetical protein